jgi:hypothetical protein
MASVASTIPCPVVVEESYKTDMEAARILHLETTMAIILQVEAVAT